MKVEQQQEKQRERVIRCYEVKVRIQAQNFVETQTLQVHTIEETEPRAVNIAGKDYHRYGDEIDYCDVQADLVIMRAVKPIYVPKEMDDEGESGPRALVDTPRGQRSV